MIFSWLPCIRPKWSGQKWAGKDRQLNLPSCIIDGTLSRNVRCTKERTDGMEWLEAMKEAVNYMEAHLMENITAEDIAAHINLSPFYFQKGFKIITGMTIGAYLRSRRLYLAALDVLAGNDRIIDLAYKYGYETPESFTKAFSRFHGAAPMQLKKNPDKLQVFQPLHIKITVEGGSNLNYTMEKMDPLPVIGLERIFSFDSAYDEIPSFWNSFKQKYCNKNAPAQVRDCCIGKYGICIEIPGNSREFRYIIAGDYRGGELPEGMMQALLPGCTIAKFRCTGPMPGSLQAVNSRIFNEWLPGNSRYEFASGFNVEMYTMGDTHSYDYSSEIWIPIREKKK